MSYQKIAKSYKTASIETASPGKIILMLYDGALRFLETAKEGAKEDDEGKRNEAIHNNLSKTADIICELQSSLNMEKGGEFAQTMYGLYDYMHRRIINANIQKDLQLIEDVIIYIKDIRSAWAEMLEKNAQNEGTQRATFSSKA